MTDARRRGLSASEFAAIETRIETLLPEIYQNDYDTVEPTPMGAAGLRFDRHGKVAWDEIWESFCDLAMAGGPPHKGAVLAPGPAPGDESGRESYAAVINELCRGIELATGLEATPSPVPGWVRVTCLSEAMAGWLLRAITMENVAVRAHGATVDLPAGAEFRLEKEIKNVVTVIAKTSHYWLEHTSFGAQRAIANLFAELAVDSPLIQPPAPTAGTPTPSAAAESMATAIRAATGLDAPGRRQDGWLGIECPSVQAAITMMRVVVTDNVLARREEMRLLVPINSDSDPGGTRAVGAVIRAYRFAVTSRAL